MSRLIPFIILFVSVSVMAQDLGERPLQKLIDCPSVGMPETGCYDFEFRAYPDGGVLAGFTVGLIKRFAIGVSYGGTEVIGFGNPNWNLQPGVTAKCRVIDESMTLPAMSLGFTSQGYGAWIDSTDQYLFKARGLFLALGKNFIVGSLGEITAHSGVNMNSVDNDSRSLNFFTGLEYRASHYIAFIAEYSGDFDNQEDSKGYGYLNLGVRWTFAERLALDLHLKDILLNLDRTSRGGSAVAGREIRISYVERWW